MIEVIELLSLLKIWGSLGKKILKEKVGESKLEEWTKYVFSEMSRIFRICAIGCLVEKGLYCET